MLPPLRPAATGAACPGRRRKRGTEDARWSPGQRGAFAVHVDGHQRQHRDEPARRRQRQHQAQARRAAEGVRADITHHHAARQVAGHVHDRRRQERGEQERRGDPAPWPARRVRRTPSARAPAGGRDRFSRFGQSAISRPSTTACQAAPAKSALPPRPRRRGQPHHRLHPRPWSGDLRAAARKWPRSPRACRPRLASRSSISPTVPKAPITMVAARRRCGARGTATRPARSVGRAGPPPRAGSGPGSCACGSPA